MAKSKKVQKHKIEKRRLFGLAGIFSLVAILLGGATIAYFKDVNRIVNKFIPANVDVDLVTQQRKVVSGAKIEELETIEHYSEINWDTIHEITIQPLVGDLDDRDQFGLSNAENYIDRITTIRNNRSVEVYLRAYIAVPKDIDEEFGINKQKALNIDFGTENNVSTEGASWIWKDDNGNWKTFLADDSSLVGYTMTYRVYYVDYKGTLAPSETSTELIKGFYFDPSLTVDGTFLTLHNNNNPGMSYLQLNWPGDTGIYCPIYAVAVQAAGFSDAETAFNTAFGENYSPFGSNIREDN